MIRPSTALYLAFCAAAVRAGADVAGGAGVWDNTAECEDLLSRAIPLDGNFRLQAQTGATLTYTHDAQANIWPASASPSSLMASLEGSVDNPVASDVFELHAFEDNTVRIRFADADKCLAAQWDFDRGLCGFGVAYGCNLGPGATYDTGLRDAKQQYLAIPVKGSSGSSGSGQGAGTGSGSTPASAGAGGNSDDSPKPAPVSNADDDEDEPEPEAAPATGGSGGAGNGACEKTADWVWRHPPSSHADYYRVHPECLGTAAAPDCRHDGVWLHRHSDYMADHPECQEVYDSYKAKRAMSAKHGKAHAKRGVMKRGESVTVQLVVFDHCYDMKTRAVTSTDVLAFADAHSAALDLYVEGQADQIWTITAV